jgi:hypothetical protein
MSRMPIMVPPPEVAVVVVVAVVPPSSGGSCSRAGVSPSGESIAEPVVMLGSLVLVRRLSQGSSLSKRSRDAGGSEIAATSGHGTGFRARGFLASRRAFLAGEVAAVSSSSVGGGPSWRPRRRSPHRLPRAGSSHPRGFRRPGCRTRRTSCPRRSRCRPHGRCPRSHQRGSGRTPHRSSPDRRTATQQGCPGPHPACGAPGPIRAT